MGRLIIGFKNAYSSYLKPDAVTGSIESSILIWDFFEKTTYKAGIIGFLIGLVVILENAGKPENLGPAVAMSLISILYSLIFVIITRILKARILER